MRGGRTGFSGRPRRLHPLIVLALWYSLLDDEAVLVPFSRLGHGTISGGAFGKVIAALHAKYEVMKGKRVWIISSHAGDSILAWLVIGGGDEKSKAAKILKTMKCPLPGMADVTGNAGGDFHRRSRLPTNLVAGPRRSRADLCPAGIGRPSLRFAADGAALVAALNPTNPITERPANKIRGIFRMFVSEVEDKRWFYDRDGWQKYLDLLATHRFNRFNLSFGLSYDFSTGLTDTYTFFMYPFFLNVPGYNVRALTKNGTPIPPDEMQKNLDTLKFISDQAALRGLDFNLGIWTHNYKWNASPNATHTIDGLTAQTQAPYSRDALKMLLETCPGITGITLRTHGESGVPEGSYDLWKIIMSGITGLKNADGTPRIIELDLHAKTMTQEMIDTAFTTQMPITISCKFWAEHMGLPYVQSSIRQAEMPWGRDADGPHGTLLRHPLLPPLRHRRPPHQKPQIQNHPPRLAGHPAPPPLGRSAVCRRDGPCRPLRRHGRHRILRTPLPLRPPVHP